MTRRAATRIGDPRDRPVQGAPDPVASGEMSGVRRHRGVVVNGAADGLLMTGVAARAIGVVGTGVARRAGEALKVGVVVLRAGAAVALDARAPGVPVLIDGAQVAEERPAALRRRGVHVGAAALPRHDQGTPIGPMAGGAALVVRGDPRPGAMLVGATLVGPGLIGVRMGGVRMGAAHPVPEPLAVLGPTVAGAIRADAIRSEGARRGVTAASMTVSPAHHAEMRASHPVSTKRCGRPTCLAPG